MLFGKDKIFGLYTPSAVDKIRSHDHELYTKSLQKFIKEEREKIKKDILQVNTFVQKKLLSNIKPNGAFICCPIIVSKNAIIEILIGTSTFDLNKITKSGEVYVYNLQDKIIGRLYFREIDKNTIYIDDTIVDYPYWRLGIGSFMVNLMEHTVKIYKYYEIKGLLSPVDINERKEQVINFWAKNGYKIKNSSIHKILS